MSMGKWWGVCLLLAISAVTDMLGSLPVVEGDGLGVNWGSKSAIPLPAVAVVDLLKRNKINKVKLFDADRNALLQLINTGIEVMVGVMNEDLIKLAYSQDDANKWVDYNVRPWIYTGGVQITYISVGNEAYLEVNEGRYDDAVPLAMEKVLTALRTFKLDKQVKVVTAMNLNVLSESVPPSAGAFNKSIVPPMQKIIQVLEGQDAPFVINIYPFLTVTTGNYKFDMKFVYFGEGGGKDNFTDKVSLLSYTNIFDASFDAVHYALRQYATKEIPIVIGEIGWPTDGDNGLGFSNMAVAQKYLNGAIKKFLSGEGTPARPNRKIDGYLFGLLDEDSKSIAPGNFERHWGICYYDGIPKFNLDLSGNADPNAQMKPPGNLHYLDTRWCVASPSATTEQLESAIAFISPKADITAILPGNGCFTNDTHLRATYALNNYYQSTNQSADSCNFNGAATITTTDPSRPNCPHRISLAIALISSDGTHVTAQSLWSTAASALFAIALLFLLAPL